MKTTLNKIRAHRPCGDGWEKLLRGLNKTQPDDEVIWIDQILEINGLADALWCLRAAEGCDLEIRLFAVWCARRVQHLMGTPPSVEALNVAERHARGEASDRELAAAWEAAAWAASMRASAAAASAAATLTWAGGRLEEEEEARDAERAAQADELRRICREMREAQP